MTSRRQHHARSDADARRRPSKPAGWRGVDPPSRVAVVVVLVALGIANIAHARAVARGRGRRAVGRARRRRDGARGRRRDRPARRAGIRARRRPARGQRRAGARRRPTSSSTSTAAATGTRLTYTLAAARARSRRSRSRSRPRRAASSMYFVLAAVGLFTLLVGASVRLRRPRDQATLHFFWLCVAFFGAFTFSFNGPFDRLDWVFYWGDAVAHGAAAAAAAALHAGLPGAAAVARRRGPLARLAAADVPAGARARRRAHRRGRRAVAATARRSRGRSRRSIAPSRLYLFVCAPPRRSSCWRARFGEITSLTGRRQLRWIAWGTVLGVGPFALRLRAAVGARRRSAARAAADGDAARPRAAHVRVARSCATGCATSRSSSSAASPTRRSSRRARRSTSAHAQARRLRVRRRRRPAQLDRRAAGDDRRRAAGAAGARRRCRTRSIACSIAIATTTAARSSASRAI